MNQLTQPAVDKQTVQRLFDAAALRQRMLADAQSITSGISDAMIDNIYFARFDEALTELATALGIQFPDTCNLPDLNDMTVDEFVETLRQMDM